MYRPRGQAFSDAKQRSDRLTDPSGEWLTQEQVAKAIGIPVHRIRPVVSALAAVKQIKTNRSIRDRRYLLVHRDSVPIARQAIYNGGVAPSDGNPPSLV
jgi:hypothetical protein